jgi:predicted O-methyltransferase YrrM
MNTINISIAENVLRALHKDAKKDKMRMGTSILKAAFRPLQPSDFENAYLPISKEQGQNIKQLIIENDCKNIVEFGTSFGISTIYMADAAQQTGGKVITSELIDSKAAKALNNITEAGLNDFVEIRIGDAMETFNGLSAPIDFLFLDGWKDLYLPLFQMLEPLLHSGTLIYADNMDMNGTQDYANYLSEKQKEYATQIVDNGKAFLSRVK